MIVVKWIMAVPVTGQLLWKVWVPGGVDLGPAAVPGARRLHGSNTRTLDAWHAGTGSKLWSFSADGLISTNIAVARGAVYFGSSDDHVYAVSAPSQAGWGGSYSATRPPAASRLARITGKRGLFSAERTVVSPLTPGTDGKLRTDACRDA